MGANEYKTGLDLKRARCHHGDPARSEARANQHR